MDHSLTDGGKSGWIRFDKLLVASWLIMSFFQIIRCDRNACSRVLVNYFEGLREIGSIILGARSIKDNSKDNDLKSFSTT